MRRDVDEKLRLIDFGKYRDVKSYYDEALHNELSKYSKGLILHAEETSLFEEATSFDGDLQAKIAECAERFETLEQKRLDNMKNGSKLVLIRYKKGQKPEDLLEDARYQLFHHKELQNILTKGVSISRQSLEDLRLSAQRAPQEIKNSFINNSRGDGRRPFSIWDDVYTMYKDLAQDLGYDVPRLQDVYRNRIAQNYPYVF